MADVKILIDGREYPLSSEMVQAMANTFPEGEEYAGLARALIGLKQYALTSMLIWSASLDQKTMDELWEEHEWVEIRRGLLENPAFLKQLSNDQVRDILEMDNGELLDAVAENWDWDDLYRDALHGIDEDDARLSSAMADELALRLLKAPRRREAILSRPMRRRMRGPRRRQYVPGLREVLENKAGLLRCNPKVFLLLDVEEAELLTSGRPEAGLQRLARFAEFIEDSEAQKLVFALLASHSDPAVRSELVKSSPTAAVVFGKALAAGEAWEEEEEDWEEE